MTAFAVSVEQSVSDCLRTAGVQTAADIAMDLDRPVHTVRVVLRRLVRAGVAVSVPGCRKGYTAYRVVTR